MSTRRDCWQKRPTISLKKGQTLFEIGAVGDGCYWLEEGVLKVSIASPQGAERILAILGPGSIVGELAMLDGLPRSATVQGAQGQQIDLRGPQRVPRKFA